MSPHQLPRFRLVAAQELRLLLKEPSLWMVGLLFLLLVAYGLLNGLHQTAQRDAAQTALRMNDQHVRGEQLELLKRIYEGRHTPGPFVNPASPANMAGGYGAHFAIMPSAPLSPVALGQTDLFPSQFKVTQSSRVNFIHNNDIENPWHLLGGHFDLAFVVVYLLPLLIFALSYNMLSAEREAGTLRLLLSQPLALRTLILGKIAVRAAVLLCAAVALPLAALMLMRTEAWSSPSLLLFWAVLVGMYLLFWFALVVFVNACGWSSATNAMTLIAVWVVAVLLLPSILNLVVTRVSPSPSRAELATRTRVLTAEAMARNAQLMSTDYQHVDTPELLVPKDGRLQTSGRAMGSYRIQREIDEAIRPELDRFDAQQARQQALVDRYSFVSPAAVAYGAMTTLAGSGSQRHAHFMRQITSYHEAWKGFFHPRIDAQRALSVEDFSAIPVFAWEEESPGVVRHAALVAIVQLAAPTLLLIALAAWRLRRFRPL